MIFCSAINPRFTSFLLTGFFLLLSLSLFAQNRTTYNFNTDWKVNVGDVANAAQSGFDAKDWKPVTLPYAWNEDEAFKKDIVDLSTGIAWYRKKFRLPLSAKDGKVFIEFEGIRQAGTFYVNGQQVGLHENGITAFGFDITPYVHFGTTENIIAARIDNSWDYREQATKTKFQWEDKNFNANYGGINKNVYLHTTGRLYQTLPLYSNLGTTGVYIYADSIEVAKKQATIHALSEVKNETAQPQTFTYEVSITNPAGKLVKRFTTKEQVVAAGATTQVEASALVSGLEFWSWGYGYLYQVKTVLKSNGQVVDAVTTRTGFRNTAFKDGMIYLNDRVMMVHGYAQRSSNEWPAIGLSVPAWLSDYSNGLMVESGANMVRWMHITPWKQDIESCDRVGLPQAMPAGDAEADVTGTRWEQRKAVMRDAIIYNRNNPSILFYECGNESISESHMQEMKAIRDTYDPNGGRAIGSREMLQSKEAEYGGEMLYTNKSAHIPMWAMEYSRDEGSRKYWDDCTPPYHKDGDGPLYKGQPAGVYNRNMESHAIENVKRWYEFWRERPGTGKRVSSGGVNIIFSETNTHHRGEENYRRSGEVDGMRIKKQNFYAHKVMWDGWVNPEKQSLHIIGHWNYKEGVQKDIYVVSSAHRVALRLNGRTISAAEKTDGFLFRFAKIQWAAGTLEAIGYDAAGKQTCYQKLETVGDPVALQLQAINRPTPLLANGHDLALVEVRVVDAKGRLCPTALNMIDFELEGTAEWRGGMAMGPGNYIGAKTLPVEGGVNRVLIRAGTKAGKIFVTAKAAGLKSASLQLSSLPFTTIHGLATQLPSAGLPGNLQRGPTPSTPSFTPERKPVQIVSAVAGANSDSAFASYDDNELSDWVNDGKISTAWIEYKLQQPTTLSEVTLKLNNFRSRSYPLLITVDGTEVYRGNTPTSLGYCTLPLKRVKGQHIKIQLASQSSQSNVNNGVEVNGKKLDDGVARNDAAAKGTLSIIECELYEQL